MGKTFCNLINLFTYHIVHIVNKIVYFLSNLDFKTSIIDEVAIATAIGSFSFSIMVTIFLIQGMNTNEEYIYSNQSAAIYDFCKLRFVIIVNSLIFFDLVLIDLRLNCYNIVYLTLSAFMYLLLLLNICSYYFIFKQSKKIITGDSKWLGFYQEYNWKIINNLTMYHNKIIHKTSCNNKKIQKQITKLHEQNSRIRCCNYKIYYREDNIFILYGEQNGILKNVDIKKIENLIKDIIAIDNIYVDICVDFENGIERDTILMMIRATGELVDAEKNKIIQTIKDKKIQLHNCFGIYTIQAQNAINSFKYLYTNKLIVNYESDTYIFNYLLYNAIFEIYDKVEEINYKGFFNVFFYNLKLISRSNSMYSFCRNCDFLINQFSDTNKNLQQWSNDKVIGEIVEVFNIVKNRYEFVQSFTLVLLYLIANKNLSNASREILFKCWFQYEEYIIENKNKDKDNIYQEYNIMKFHFNAIILYYIDLYNNKLKNTESINDEENSTSESGVDIDYQDAYFKNYNIFDYLRMLNSDSDLFRNFVYLNYGLDNSKAQYDLFIMLIKYYKPDVHFSEKDFEIHFNDIKSYRFQYIYHELLKNDYKDDEYKNELRNFIGQLIKKQVNTGYCQKYLDNFNNYFANNLVDKSNITLMHIYLRILQKNKLIIKSDEIDNCVVVPYNKLIFKDLYSDDIWSASECSSISYLVCYDLDKELLRYFCDNAVELDKEINFEDFICISIFNADIKFEYRVKYDDLKIGNEYYKYLFVKKDSLPELIWPNNPKFDLNIDGKLNNINANKLIERTISKNINKENIGRLIIYNAPMLKYKDNVVIYKSKFLSKN